MATTTERTFGVFLHSSGTSGGYVVRPLYDGWAPAPYSTSVAVALYRRESAAQKYADRLNAAARFAQHGYS